jgi:hypothetical protein
MGFGKIHFMYKAILFFLLIPCENCFSQSQDLKQLELDIQKLAQLKSMLSEMSRGYSILDKGYGSIKDLSQGNYNLHKTYLDKLLDVSVSVKNNPKTASVMNLQAQIAAVCASSQQMVNQSTAFNGNEKTSLITLLQNIISQSYSLLDELKLVSTPGVLRMSDAERMRVIDRIENAMKEKLIIVLQQTKNIDIVIAGRNKQLLETQQLKSLF